jgi:hypothetical protein
MLLHFDKIALRCVDAAFSIRLLGIGSGRRSGGAVGNLTAFVVWFCLAGSLRAELPLTRLQTVFPPGGMAGATIEVSVTGTDLDDANAIHFSIAGITATPKLAASGQPEANRFLVKIAAGVPPGIYDARVTGRFGISNPRAFAVGTGAEMTEGAGNQSVAAAMRVSSGATVNGRATAAAADFFVFDAKAGQRLLIGCQTAEIDSRMDAVLVLSSKNGRELDRARHGGLIDFTAPSDGAYVVEVHDLLFRGGDEYFYRLTIGTGPHLDFIFPPAGPAGSKQEYTVYGRNLPGGKPAPERTIQGKPLEKLAVQIEIPAATKALRPTGVSMLLKPSQAPLDAVEYRLTSAAGVSNPLLLGIATAPVIAEVEPNNKPAQAQPLQPPCEVAGEFYPDNDPDWFTFTAKKGGVFRVELFSQRLGLESDPFLLAQRVAESGAESGKVSDLQEVYDSDTNIGGRDFNTADRDPAWRFEAPEEGVYRLLVRDLFNQSQPNAALVYRLAIREESPGFHLVALAPAPPSTEKDKREVRIWTPFLRRGEAVPIRVLAFREDGFNGEIEVTVEDLPKGVTVAPVKIPAGQAGTILMLRAGETAGDWSGALRVIGRARIGKEDVIREARGGGVTWNVDDYNNEAVVSRVQRDFTFASSAEESPFSVEPAEDKTWEGTSGAKVQIPLKLVRRGEFNDGVKLRAVWPGQSDPLAEWDIDGKAATSSLELDLAKAKLPVGIHQLHLIAYTKGKYRRLRPEEVKAAEAAAKTAEESRQQAGKAVAEFKAAEKKAGEAAGAAAQNSDAQQAAKKTAAEAAAKAKEAGARMEDAARLAKEIAAKLEMREVSAAFYSPVIRLAVVAPPTPPGAEAGKAKTP